MAYRLTRSLPFISPASVQRFSLCEISPKPSPGFGGMEAHAEDGGEEVDGVTGEVALWPTPVGVFYDETQEGGEVEVMCFAFDESEEKAAPILTILFPRSHRN